jgi:C_GCAxxG_C_C family probable redox protein
MTKQELAVYNFCNQMYNCAQSILLVYCEDYNISKETAAQMAASFGNGIAKQGEICSVLIEALAILGLKSKRDFLSDANSNVEMMNEAKEFVNKFVSMAGGLKCRDLLGCDPDSEAGTLYIANNNLKEKICKKVLIETIKLLEANKIRSI